MLVRKQIFPANADHDQLARIDGSVLMPAGFAAGEALLRPVMIGGRLENNYPQLKIPAAPQPPSAYAALPTPCHSLFEGEGAWPVERVPELESLYERVRKGSRHENVFFDVDSAKSISCNPAGALVMHWAAERVVPNRGHDKRYPGITG